jgi:hypothetical protein
MSLRMARRSRTTQRAQNRCTVMEHLEQRVVLSSWGGDLLGPALDAIGVVNGPVVAPSQSTSSGSSGQTSQLQKDIEALQTELASLAAKSGVTVADLTSLANDSRTIAQTAGSPIDIKSLDSAVDELATAIAAGTSSTQAQTDFTAYSPVRACRRRRCRRRSPT